jgi:hypothetical protein
VSLAGRSCYVCRAYSYNGKRHPTCQPKYHRARLSECDRCGKLAVGKRHRACGDNPKRPCVYCGEPTKGQRFHNRCTPVALGALAVFADDPYVVQRQCSDCGDWFPFASIEGQPAEPLLFWNRHGKAPGGRPLFDGMCKACKAERRKGHNSPRVAPDVAAAIVAERTSRTIPEIAVRHGVSTRTVIRYGKRAAAA